MIRVFYPSQTYPLSRCDSCGAVYAADFTLSFCWICRLLEVWPQVKNPHEDWKTNPTSAWEYITPKQAQQMASEGFAQQPAAEQAIPPASGRIDFAHPSLHDIAWIDEAIEEGFRKADGTGEPKIVPVRVLRNVQSAVKDAYLKRMLTKK